MSEKIWADIPGHPGYQASTEGDIKNINTGNTLSPMVGSTGYLVVTLRVPEKPGKQRKAKVHRLVALAHLPPPKPGQTYVNHIDSVRTNPRLDNLEWCSPRENIQHALRDGHLAYAKGGGFTRATEEERGKEYVKVADRPYELKEDDDYLSQWVRKSSQPDQKGEK